MILRILFGVITWLALVSCGGSGGSSSDTTAPPPPAPPPPAPPPPAPVQTLTGQFIDATVQGLVFNTPTQSGSTNANGEYAYLGNETISFSFGGIALGRAIGQRILTPLDLQLQEAELQQTMMSFLQSLDADNDLSNGIELTSEVASRLSSYVAEQPQINTFQGIVARSDYPALVGRISNRSEWITGTTALNQFNAAINPLISQGLYQRPNTPPPTGGACPNQPNLQLADVTGGPFTDCGPTTSTRIPSPTTVVHGFGGRFPGDPAGMNFQTACILPGWEVGQRSPFPDFPNLSINPVDQIYYNTSSVFGVITFTGQRVQWNDLNGGASVGFICGPDAADIEYNGNCVCP